MNNPLHALDVKSLDEYLFPTGEFPDRTGPRTDAVFIQQDGKVIYEKYANNYTLTTKHLLWSISKSILSLLAGIAVDEGKLKIEDSICKYGFDRHCDLRVQHLLEWSSGLEWSETYEENESPTKSSVLQMLYGEGRDDKAEYVIEKNAEANPGERWNYSSGDSMLLSAVIHHAFKDEPNYFHQKLANPLDWNAFWETDRKNHLVGSSYLYLNARDLAKAGELFLNSGKWKNVQIVTPAWLSYSLKPSTARREKSSTNADPIGGAQWWLNRTSENNPKFWPELPEDTFAALGHWGQILLVIPSQKLIAVRLGDTRDNSYTHREFGRLLK